MELKAGVFFSCLFVCLSGARGKIHLLGARGLHCVLTRYLNSVFSNNSRKNSSEESGRLRVSGRKEGGAEHCY